MAAAVFLVVILGLLVAGRAQALAAEDGTTLRFQIWQLGLGTLVLLVFAAHFALGTPLPAASGGISMVKGGGLLAALAVLAVYAFRPRSSEDF